MVNHLWVEDTYAKWKVMTLTNPKYTHFPRRTNLQEVVGQTRIDLDALVPFYHYDSPEPAVATVAAAAAAGGGGGGGGGIGSSGVTKSMVSKLATTNLGTPVPTKRRKGDGEDSPAPPSTGSRKAKEKASARLHDTIMPDVILYQKELKRKGGVLGGGGGRPGRAGSDDSTNEKPIGSSGSSRKRPKSADASDDDNDADDRRAPKKSKKRPPKPAIFLLITAYTGWLDKPHKEDDDKACPLSISIPRERESS